MHWAVQMEVRFSNGGIFCQTRVRCNAAGQAGRTLIGVVVHYVKDDLNPSGVQCAHKLLELACCSQRTAATLGKASHGCEEVHVGVAPDVDHVVARVVRTLELQLIELQNRQDFHRCDAQLY